MATGSGNAYVTASSSNTTEVAVDAASAITIHVPSTSANPLYVEVSNNGAEELHDSGEGVIIPAGSSDTFYAVTGSSGITSFLPKGVGGDATYSWGRKAL